MITGSSMHQQQQLAIITMTQSNHVLLSITVGMDMGMLRQVIGGCVAGLEMAIARPSASSSLVLLPLTTLLRSRTY